MGLTLYWDLNYEGDHEKVEPIFQSLADVVKNSSFGNPPSGPFFIENGICQDPESKPHLRFCLFYADRNRDGTPDYPEEMFLVVGDPGPGSETAQFYMGRFAGESHWTGTGSCKTQYAKHFVESHGNLVAWLDVFRKAGVHTDVCDEGNYWDTRDVSKLLKSYERFNFVLDTFSEGLKKSGAKVEGEAPAYTKHRKNRLN